MRKFILSTVTFMLFANFAAADVIDDNLAKAEKSLVTAQKRLDIAKQCIANRPVCVKEMTAKAQAANDRAAAKLAALKSASAE